MRIVYFNQKEEELLNKIVQDSLYNTEKAIREGAAASDANVNADKVRLINILKKI